MDLLMELQHTFRSVPFYARYHKCGGCRKRSVWLQMSKCNDCPLYCHRRCVTPALAGESSNNEGAASVSPRLGRAAAADPIAEDIGQRQPDTNDSGDDETETPARLGGEEAPPYHGHSRKRNSFFGLVKSPTISSRDGNLGIKKHLQREKTRPVPDPTDEPVDVEQLEGGGVNPEPEVGPSSRIDSGVRSDPPELVAADTAEEEVTDAPEDVRAQTKRIPTAKTESSPMLVIPFQGHEVDKSPSGGVVAAAPVRGTASRLPSATKKRRDENVLDTSFADEQHSTACREGETPKKSTAEFGADDVQGDQKSK